MSWHGGGITFDLALTPPCFILLKMKNYTDKQHAQLLLFNKDCNIIYNLNNSDELLAHRISPPIIILIKQELQIFQPFVSTVIDSSAEQ